MGDLAGVPKIRVQKTIEYYLNKTSLLEHRKKKMKNIRWYEKASGIGAGAFK